MSEINDVIKVLEDRFLAKISLKRNQLHHSWELRCYPPDKPPFGIYFDDLPLSDFVIEHLEKEISKS